ncbi:MAG: gamma-glutamyl-gamma-aminobutyrate hydrolase family protein [Wolinella sp.]
MNKRIGITQRLFEASEYKELREGLDVRWGRLFRRLGWHMVALSYAIPFETYMSELDGVILSGGNDLNSIVPNALNRQRETYEREILRLAKERAIPLLGICRGAQLIAHEYGSEIIACKGHVGSHEVIFQKERLEVNSFHNYAINIATHDSPLTPLAHSPEGNIEAFCIENVPILGVMWHIEREERMSAASARMIEYFKELLR